MNKDEFDTLANEIKDDLDQTLEINSLEELNKRTIKNQDLATPRENERTDELDVSNDIVSDAIDDANLVFETQIKTEEKIKKERLFKRLKKKWQKLGGIEKSLVILGILLVIAVIALVIIFAIPEKKEEKKEKERVILEVDNYRYEDGKLVFLDKEEEIGEYSCEHKDQNNCEVAYYTEDNSYDTTIIVDDKEKSIPIRSKIFNKRYVFVRDGESTIKLYDIKEDKTIKEGQKIRLYEDKYVVMESDSKEGLISFNDEEMSIKIPYEYDKIHVISNTENLIAIVSKDNSYYLADLDNKILTRSFNDPIMGANKDHLKVKSGTTYKVYDYQGKETDIKGADYARLLSDYIVSVKDNALYVFDYEGNRYNINGYRLHNNNYNGKEIYKDLKLTKTEKSFDIDGSAYVMNLTIYNNDQMENFSINLSEGRMSKELMYMNYFDGTIYFYDDTKKENLIGSYGCNNKNEVNYDTKTLGTCRIAKESIYRETEANQRERGDFGGGTIPVFGKRYIFIQDGDTIVLYDLKDSKSMASYSGVDTSSYTGSSDDLIYSDAITIPYIAQSKNSSLYGVAKISSEGVTSIIGFNHKSIKRLGDYFVVEDDGKYSLYNLAGEEKSSKIPAQIVDYNGKYLKAKKDDQYFIYDFEGKKIRENEAYTYAELYDDFFAAIIQNTVHVIDYKGTDYVEPLPKETKDSLKVQVKNFYDGTSGALSFKVSKEGKFYVISIGTVSGDYEKVSISTTIPKKEEIPEEQQNTSEEKEDGDKNE